MQRHPAELTHAWFAQAERDLDSAKALVAATRYEAACFHAQQSVANALKGLLVWLHGDRPRTHEIERLVAEVELAGEDIGTLSELAALDPYYVTTRYPDAVGGGVPGHKFFLAEAEAAIARAERGLTWIRARLPESREP